MDTQVEKILDDKKAGLADNTIVFYYPNQGGVLPRGKRYLDETGVKVPMIVSIPENCATSRLASPATARPIRWR